MTFHYVRTVRAQLLAPLLYVTGILMLASLTGCGPSIPETVRIGVAVTLSGPSANRGQDLLNGAALAAEELNQSNFKIDGKTVKFEIVPKDDKADPETIKKVAQELVDSHVHAVIGHVNSEYTKLAVPIYASKNIPHLFTSSSKVLMARSAGNTFRLVANDEIQAKAIAYYATQILHAQKFAVVVEDSEYGQELFGDLSEALLGASQRVALKSVVNSKQPVSDEFVEKIKSAQSDVVVVLGREVHALSLLEKLKKIEYTGVTVLLSSAAKTNKVAKVEVVVNRLLATTSTIDPSELFEGKAFLQRFDDKYKSAPVWGAHYAYEAVYVLADAMRRARSVDSKAVIVKLKTSDLNSKAIQMKFLGNGEQKDPGIGVYEVRSGVWIPQMRASNW